ncbi:MAG TPA: ComEA family DNA-binding protein [Gaiellaceae bacterium]|nr:ComEA family DNA-binding protein [Gaiellaceae bacterium]
MDGRLPALSHRRLAAFAVLLALALVLAVRHLGGGGRASAGAATTPAVVAPVKPAHAPAKKVLVVDVAGAVRRPGLYRLPSGSRIQNAIVAAGGATRKAQLDAVNLAAPLADGEQVLVPGSGAAAAAVGSASASEPSPSAPLDLNTATAEQLDALPGVGPVTAQKIIAYRQAHGPFHAVDELQGVPGIGPAKMAQLKGLVIP